MSAVTKVIRHNQASGAYQRWEPENFERSKSPPENVAPEPEPQAEEGEQSLEIAPGVSLPTAADIERLHQEAYREGYAAGYEEGSARGRLEASQIHQLLQSMDEALAQLDGEVAEEVQALALEIARQVVRDTLTANPDAIRVVIREALAQVPHIAAVIRINPQDAERIRQYLGENAHGLEHRIAEDDSIEPGGAIVESAGGQIDAQINTRWRRIVENISRNAGSLNP